MNQLLFLIFVILTVFPAGLIVLRQNSRESCGLLFLIFLATSGIFLLLEAPFLALVQIFNGTLISLAVYIFAVKMAGREEQKVYRVNFFNNGFSFFAVILFVSILLVLTSGIQFSRRLPGRFELELAGGLEAAFIAELLFERYVFFLQVVAGLLLVTIIGCRLLIVGKNTGRGDER
ncbi:MAG: NADH-quinone oxidoreductase subunit J [bacterium]